MNFIKSSEENELVSKNNRYKFLSVWQLCYIGTFKIVTNTLDLRYSHLNKQVLKRVNYKTEQYILLYLDNNILLLYLDTL